MYLNPDATTCSATPPSSLIKIKAQQEISGEALCEKCMGTTFLHHPTIESCDTESRWQSIVYHTSCALQFSGSIYCQSC
ncbi:hypothetical protein SLEP1_g41322 [Rubroshorea leprosula]|uniref:Uncharacterized protein n=1 Tax=Rubroshorea leprosula TaxID=152421 RepID=A0AAV5L6T1_9ROSI|nr:hypothetical protein SLEP1_g41322 [Rubroshorea leprosula]